MNITNHMQSITDTNDEELRYLCADLKIKGLIKRVKKKTFLTKSKGVI